MKEKKKFSLYKVFVYVALIALAITIIVPIVWVFMASVKSQSDLVQRSPRSCLLYTSQHIRKKSSRCI